MTIYFVDNRRWTLVTRSGKYDLPIRRKPLRVSLGYYAVFLALVPILVLVDDNAAILGLSLVIAGLVSIKLLLTMHDRVRERPDDKPGAP